MAGQKSKIGAGLFSRAFAWYRQWRLENTAGTLQRIETELDYLKSNQANPLSEKIIRIQSELKLRELFPKK
jgi:hypothetical protein